jgi:hypothetical protein
MPYKTSWQILEDARVAIARRLAFGGAVSQLQLLLETIALQDIFILQASADRLEASTQEW